MLFLSFFFFQAEDGIRDHCVTGVQTCALPISFGIANFSMALSTGCVVSSKNWQCQKQALLPSNLHRRSITHSPTIEIGRASCRERVYIWWGGVSFRKKREARHGSERWK